eukprot:scaffold76318_cov45-Phaeocystis_antarctica.AAC.2
MQVGKEALCLLTHSTYSASQIAAAQHVSSSETEADGDQLSLLKALVERPEGAAAAVVVLQDR